MSNIKVEFIRNKAIELADDENYYEKVYINFVFTFIKKFKEFYKNNKKTIDSWINNDLKKADKVLFLYKVLKTITFTKENEVIIDYSVLETFVEIKDKKNKEKLINVLIDMEEDLKKDSLNIINLKEFRELNSFAQLIISFIKDRDDRIEIIYFNLKELENMNIDQEIEDIYIDLNITNEEKFTTTVNI